MITTRHKKTFVVMNSKGKDVDVEVVAQASWDREDRNTLYLLDFEVLEVEGRDYDLNGLWSVLNRNMSVLKASAEDMVNFAESFSELNEQVINWVNDLEPEARDVVNGGE